MASRPQWDRRENRLLIAPEDVGYCLTVGQVQRKPRDAVAAYVDTRALGRLERRVDLAGKLPIDATLSKKASLCLTTRGLWLVAAQDALHGVAIDLLEEEDLRLETGRLRAQLHLGQERLAVPPHRRRDVAGAIAIARLREAGGRASHQVPTGRHLEAPDEAERTFLAGFLEPDELLLAWLRSTTTVSVDSTILSDARGELSLVLTDRRAALLALSAVGDVRVEPLDAKALELSNGTRGVTIRGGERQLTSLRRNAELFREACQLAKLEGNERLLEAARLNWLDRRTLGPSLCRALLDAAARRGSGLAQLAAFLVGEALGESDASRPQLDTALQWLETQAAPDRTVAELWQSWQHSTATAHRLIEALRARGAAAEPWALALHRTVHSRAEQVRTDPSEATLADLGLAEHLLDRSEHTQATALLEARLRALPSEAIEDLHPPTDTEPSTSSDAKILRSRVYELLATAKGGPDGPDLEALLELARLHPLEVERVAALASRASGELQQRAERVVQLLEPGALAGSVPLQQGPVRPLSDTLLGEVMKHPLSRSDSPLLSKLQTLLALVPVPDHSALRDYCERLSPQRKSAAVAALEAASVLLGLSGVEAYISRGIKGVGLRAYEGAPPFVLVGGQHLDPQAPYHLGERELRFAVGAELAHLRYGHHRVTVSEVWAGAMSKGKQGLGLALGVLPVLKGWWVADRVATATSRIPTSTVKKVLQAARDLNERVGASLPTRPSGTNRDVISALNEEFVVAHRVMQLTADRAGLVLAGDLHAAVRAMLVVRRDYQDELQAVEKDGLTRVLGQRAEDGHLAYLDLALRVAALLSFYLSEDYTRLSAAMG